MWTTRSRYLAATWGELKLGLLIAIATGVQVMRLLEWTSNHYVDGIIVSKLMLQTSLFLNATTLLPSTFEALSLSR
jgi:hypothetical protein